MAAELKASDPDALSGVVDDTTLVGLSLSGGDTTVAISLLREAAGATGEIGSTGLETVLIEKLKPVVEAGVVIKRFFDTPKEEEVVAGVASSPNRVDTDASNWLLVVSAVPVGNKFGD